MIAPVLPAAASLYQPRGFASLSRRQGRHRAPPFDDGANRAVSDSFDLDDFRSRVFAGENSNRSSRNCEGVRKQFHELLIRRAVDRWRIKPHLQGFAMN